mmetsp:Transcript_11718/g.32011  ORF Transcript_11718/g.32011 Transcript_11718/m.32011 type:complete len:214 (-) Transcript_11718:1039-1680(-)
MLFLWTGGALMSKLSPTSPQSRFSRRNCSTVPKSVGLTSKKTPPSTTSSSLTDHRGPNFDASSEPAHCVSVVRMVAMALPLTLSLTIWCSEPGVSMNFFMNSTSRSKCARFPAISWRLRFWEMPLAWATASTERTCSRSPRFSGNSPGTLRASRKSPSTLGCCSTEKTSHSVIVVLLDSASDVSTMPPPSACWLYVAPRLDVNVPVVLAEFWM